MQIRVANRQDEPIIRTIVGQAETELGLKELDLTGKDADLMDIEAHYFWNDGIFVVAEDDGTIVGLAGAHRGESEDTLELVRLVVVPARRHTGVARLMVDVIDFFASNAEYKRLAFHPANLMVEDKSPYPGFVKDPSDAQRWIKPVATSPLSRMG